MEFLGNHILSIDQFDKDDIVKVFSIAEKMIPYANREKKTRVLQGAILSNMIFEASTRTRISFGSAFNLLGGEVRETTGIEASSLAKGESLYDTARVLSGYSDLIVMRHPEKNSVQEFSEASRVPVINAGDGSHEHPTQAILDALTIIYHKKKMFPWDRERDVSRPFRGNPNSKQGVAHRICIAREKKKQRKGGERLPAGFMSRGSRGLVFFAALRLLPTSDSGQETGVR